MNLQSSENIEFQFENTIEQFELLLSDKYGNEINSSVKEIPSKLVLNQNYPNPFNPQTNINFSIHESMNVHLNIYNTKGKLVDQLVNGFYEAGDYNFNWDIGDYNHLASGVYIYKLVTPNQTLSSKMILMK